MTQIYVMDEQKIEHVGSSKSYKVRRARLTQFPVAFACLLPESAPSNTQKYHVLEVFLTLFG